MTSRRNWLMIPMMLMACENASDRAELLPMSLDDVWRRVNVENMPPEEYPQEYKRRGLKRARRALYQGPARLMVTLYDMGAQAVAFELVQQFRPEPGKMALHEGQYFVVISGDAPVDQMQKLAESLEKVLKAK